MDGRFKKPRAIRMQLCRGLMLIVGLSIAGVTAAIADPATPAGVTTDDQAAELALHWFMQMQAGRIDRSQYTAAYAAQLTDAAVQAMSQHLNQYGASPLRAEIMQRRVTDSQTFYLVKLIFPRGDAASLLLSLDATGRITGIGVASLPGD